MLDMTLRDLERVLYFEAYVVVDPGMTQLEKGQLLSEAAYYDAIEEYGDEFEAKMVGCRCHSGFAARNQSGKEVPRLHDELLKTSSDAKHKKCLNV